MIVAEGGDSCSDEAGRPRPRKSIAVRRLGALPRGNQQYRLTQPIYKNIRKIQTIKRVSIHFIIIFEEETFWHKNSIKLRKCVYMGTIRKNIYLYILIIIVPTLLALFISWKYLSYEEEANRKVQAGNIVNLHQQYINTLIKETSKSLEILSLVSMNKIGNVEAMTELLTLTKKTEQRYGNLYYSDKNGIILTGTDNKYNGLKVQNIYTEDCKAQKNIYVSDKITGENDSYSYFFICKPILNEDSSIEGFLHVELRLDYIRNVLEMLTPNVAGKITNQQQQPILLLNEDQDHNSYDMSVPFTDVPWVLHINIQDEKEVLNFNALLNFIISFIIIAHIIFFIIQYIQFKREAKRQKKAFDNEKFHVIGTLAATTAHEIKNPLTGIKGLIQLLSEKYKQPEDAMYFSVIQKEITRINNIVNDFLFLGKPTSQQPFDLVNLQDVLAELKPILEGDAANKNITIKFKYDQRPFIITCYKDQVKQVILNIAKNSFEACEAYDEVSIGITEENSQAIITIQDNGHGMSKDVLNQVFEPFFTTKDYGTGLGLFVCQRIIHFFKGSIHISSEERIGTSIQIKLPLRQIN